MGKLSEEIPGMSENKDVIPAIQRIRELINELDVIADTELKDSSPDLYAAIYRASITIRGELFAKGYFDLIVGSMEKDNE
jgi:hypothetical protein